MKYYKFNKIFIVESISPIDEALYANGMKLKHTINDCIRLNFPEKNVANETFCELIHINGFIEWEEFWKQLNILTQNGCIPILHLILHGSPQYIAIWDSQKNKYLLETWQNGITKLEQINIYTHNNLFVSMSVCFGMRCLTKLLIEGHRLPFCGLAAVNRVIYANEADEYFSNLYKNIFKATSINELTKNLEVNFDEIENNRRNLTLLNINSAESIFTNAYKQAYKYLQEDNNLTETIIKNMTASGKTITKEHLQEFGKLYLSKNKAIFDIIVNSKFMFDLFPEEKTRFNLLYKISNNF